MLNINLWNINASEQCKWNNRYDNAIEKYIGERCETDDDNNENARGPELQERWWCRVTSDEKAWNASKKRDHYTQRLDLGKV